MRVPPCFEDTNINNNQPEKKKLGQKWSRGERNILDDRFILSQLFFNKLRRLVFMSFLSPGRPSGPCPLFYSSLKFILKLPTQQND
jgi:hypothetical protein